MQSHITDYRSLRFKVSGFLPAGTETLPQNVTPKLEQYSSKASSMCGEAFFCRRLFSNTSLSKLFVLKSASPKVGKVLLVPFCTVKLLNTNVQPNEDRETVLLLKDPLFSH